MERSAEGKVVSIRDHRARERLMMEEKRAKKRAAGITRQMVFFCDTKNAPFGESILLRLEHDGRFALLLL